MRQVSEMIGVFIQAEQLLFQSFIPDFGTSLGWLVVTSTVYCSDWPFFLLITWSGANILLDFSYVSRHQRPHDQGEMREDIRMLMANIRPQCVSGSFDVHKSTLYCHRHRLCGTRKNNDCLRSERPSQLTDPAKLSACLFCQ